MAARCERLPETAARAQGGSRQTDCGWPFLRQLKAIKAWGTQAPQDLGAIRKAVLVANGDQDKMVPSRNSIDLARRLPNAELVLYEDAGHGGIFQYHEAFVKKALGFLEA
jgi:pimeloyl-ACP methyl ester carboxylesterase